MSLSRRTSPAGAAAPEAGTLVLATLNVRHTADRWRARAPLLIEQLVALDPDVIGLQEVRRFPDQARWIARRAAPAGTAAWQIHKTYKTGLKCFWEGIAGLSRLPVTGHARLGLGNDARVAQRITVELPDGRALDVYNAHLADGDEPTRTAQARRLLTWMDERPDMPQVLVGDLNSRPTSAPLRLLTTRLRSAYAVVHGTEPPRTVPGDGVLDYILVNELVEVHDAWLVFDAPSPTDPSLLPSDHFGVAAALSLPPARKPPARRPGRRGAAAPADRRSRHPRSRSG
jgi:endonuclease/exonuclease/phosphatase family metal-dependent hydrolase